MLHIEKLLTLCDCADINSSKMYEMLNVHNHVWRMEGFFTSFSFKCCDVEQNGLANA